jgi:hypothetical protein
MMATSEKAPALESLLARLPERIDGWRVLAVGGKDGTADAFEARGAAEVVCAEPSEQLRADSRSFDLAHCAELESDLQPMSLYAWLWQVTAPGSLLLLEAAVLPDAADSQYARFVPPDESPTGRSHWLPGRLTLRWMVENSGFDLQGWIPDSPSAADPAVARLQAVRVERSPARDLDRHPLGRQGL